MSNSIFNVIAGNDNISRNKLIIPVQYCDLETFKELELFVITDAKMQIPAKKEGLEFEVELELPIGNHKLFISLKRKQNEIDQKEIEVIVEEGQINENTEINIIFRETVTSLKKSTNAQVFSSFYSNIDEFFLIGNKSDLDILDSRTFECKYSLTGHSSVVEAIDFNKENNSYLTAGKDKILRWDLNKRSPLEIIYDKDLSNSTIYGFFNDCKYFIFSKLYKDFLTIVDLELKKEIFEIELEKNNKPVKIAYDINEQLLILGFILNNQIKVYSLSDKKFIETPLMLESNRIETLNFIPGKKMFLSHSQYSDHLKLWDYNWNLVKKLNINDKTDIAEILVLKNNQDLIIFHKNGMFNIYDLIGASL
jgi:WD40 repeat protein